MPRRTSHKHQPFTVTYFYGFNETTKEAWRSEANDSKGIKVGTDNFRIGKEDLDPVIAIWHIGGGAATMPKVGDRDGQPLSTTHNSSL